MCTDLVRRFLRMPEGSGPRTAFPVDSPEEIQAEDQLKVEISDLAPEDAGKSYWQRISRRQRLRLFSVLGMSLLVVVVILLGLNKGLATLFLARPLPGAGHSGPVKIKPTIQILPQQDGFACIMDAAWSPDSKRIALLGYQQDCPQNGQMYRPGLEMVYDATSGRVEERLNPDSAILGTLRMNYPGEHPAPVIFYDTIFWSPDGRLLALLFSVVDGPDADAASYNGVLLSQTGSGYTQVMLQRGTTSVLHVVEWDLENGRLVSTAPAPSIAPLFPFAISVSPAYTYSWGENGELVPQALPANVVQPLTLLAGPVGNPIGGASFTIWQPGRIVYTTQAESGSPQEVGLISWETIFAAWSPDGRYLAYPIAMGGLFESSHQTFKNLQLESVPLLAAHDTALQRILGLLPQASPLESAMISWRFDGRVLAAYGSGVPTPGLYDSTTGAELASLQLPTINGGPLSGGSWMRWSPDGSHLFLLDRGIGVTVWGSK